jgi:hypothetical protein
MAGAMPPTDAGVLYLTSRRVQGTLNSLPLEQATAPMMQKIRLQAQTANTTRNPITITVKIPPHDQSDSRGNRPVQGFLRLIHDIGIVFFNQVENQAGNESEKYGTDPYQQGHILGFLIDSHIFYFFHKHSPFSSGLRTPLSGGNRARLENPKYRPAIPDTMAKDKDNALAQKQGLLNISKLTKQHNS